MILSNEDIKRAIKSRRIVFEPRINDDQIGPASVDLSLSNRFARIKDRYASGTIDLSKKSFIEVTEQFEADSVELAPGDLVLATTREKITLANNICGWLGGRSRYARLGLIVHTTSAFVQPGSSNHQVLEIVNLSRSNIILREGMQVSQIVFEGTGSGTSKPYSKFGKIARDQ